jgi:hypothetical protein
MLCWFIFFFYQLIGLSSHPQHGFAGQRSRAATSPQIWRTSRTRRATNNPA